jgi:hypothetical protein
MAHGKETPRQKMIGMMYLVLMALLALNVSKDVLDAFAVLDNGLVATLSTIESTNINIIGDFEEQFELNKEKVGPYRNRAVMVKNLADSVVNLIQDYKIKVIKEAEGEESKAIEGRNILGKNIEAKDNKDAPARVMIESEKDKGGVEIKNAIADFRTYLHDIISDSAMTASFGSLLDTEAEHHGPDTKVHTWEDEHFLHVPLAGVISIMSGLQLNVRNAESDALRYLYSGISATDFKFNKLEATVIPNSNFIIRGNEYKADVFLAASDSTATPTVYVTESSNPYDSVYDKLSGTYLYKKRQGVDYKQLPVTPGSGKGVFSFPAKSIGAKSWGGIIELRGPSGNIIARPFKRSFVVGEGSVVVSATKMNVFYLGVDNPVDVSVAGIQPDKVSISVTNGKYVKRRGGYIIKPRRPGNSFVIVSAEIDGKRRQVGREEFRVKTVPDPYPSVADKKGGVINKNLLEKQVGVAAKMPEDFDFDLSFRVTKFKVSASVGGFFKEVESNSYKFTREQKNLIRSLGRGDRVYIEEIVAVGPDGIPRKLPPIPFVLN